jgi:hypothetical protein
MYFKLNLVLVRLEIELVSAQDRCTIYTECTTGCEIFSGKPKVLQGDVGHMEVRFGLFGDSINLDPR